MHRKWETWFLAHDTKHPFLHITIIIIIIIIHIMKVNGERGAPFSIHFRKGCPFCRLGSPFILLRKKFLFILLFILLLVSTR